MWEFLILIPFAVAGIAGLQVWWRLRFARLQDRNYFFGTLKARLYRENL